MKTWIWLSHSIGNDTPGYSGSKPVSISHDKRMCAGDSCNTLDITLSNHAGTHVDAPRHFVEGGMTVDAYSPGDWIFECPKLISLSVEPGDLIDWQTLGRHCTPDEQTDCVLLKTGFGDRRHEDVYWKKQPGFAPELAAELTKVYPSLRAIFLDTISISSIEHRETGRAAHRAFLQAGLRIFEDVKLSVLEEAPEQIIAFPLLVSEGDGAPCSIAASVETMEHA